MRPFRFSILSLKSLLSRQLPGAFAASRAGCPRPLVWLSSLLAGVLAMSPGLSWGQTAPLSTGAAGTAGSVNGQNAFASDSSLIKVNFPNSPVQALIPFYTQLTGKKMILDSSLQGESLRIIAPKPLSKQEAETFIVATLLLNGYAIIPFNEDTVKLIHHTGGKSVGAEGLPVFNSIKDLPKGEQIVHYVMPLENISPQEAEKAFKEVIQLHAYGRIHSVPNSSAVIITENTTTIRSLFDIAQIIDVPPAEIANEMIKLERSDAESIAEIINEIYEEKEKSDSAPQSGGQNPQAVASTPGQPQAPGSRNPSVPNANGGSATSDTNPTAAKVKVIPYRRTNELLVIARPVDITYIKGLVEKLDRQTDSTTFLKKKLKYMPVADFMPVAYKALAKDTDIQADGDGGPTGSSSGPSLRRSSNTASTDRSQSQSSSFGQQNSFNNPYNSNIGGGSGSGGSFSNAGRTVLDDPDSAGVPESVVVGRTLLIADPQSNSLIVSGSPEHISMIDKLIMEMDVRPQQIYISTVIGQLNVGDEYKYGLDFLQLMNDFTFRRVREVTTTTDSSSTITNDTTGSSVTTDSTGTTTTTEAGTTADTASTTVVNNGDSNLVNTATSLVADAAGLIDVPLDFNGFNWHQLNLYGQISSIGKYLHLMEQDKNFKVLSRPSVYTRNNTKAVISSGQRIAVPTNILSNGGFASNIASTSASIDYRDVVLKLEVIPLINSDDEVTLKIAQLNDNIIGSQTISNNTIPTIGTQELNTEVTVRSGETVVLGGLITEREGNNGKGVIFLRRIPLLKHLFGTTEKSKTREELLIFIQPNIIKSRDPLSKPNEIEAGRSRAFEESLNFAGPDRPIRKAVLAE